MFFVQEDKKDILVEGDSSSLQYLPPCNAFGREPSLQTIVFKFDEKLVNNLEITKSSSLGEKFGEKLNGRTIAQFAKSVKVNFTSIFNEQLEKNEDLNPGSRAAKSRGYVPEQYSYFPSTRVLKNFYLYTNFYKNLVDLYRQNPPKRTNLPTDKSLIEILSANNAGQIGSLKQAINNSQFTNTADLTNRLIVSPKGEVLWLDKLSNMTGSSNDPLKKILLPANRQNTELPKKIYIKYSIDQKIQTKIIWTANIRLKYNIVNKTFKKGSGSGLAGDLSVLLEEANVNENCEKILKTYIEKNRDSLQNIIQQKLAAFSELDPKYLTNDFKEQIKIENDSIYIDMPVVFSITDSEVTINGDVYIPYSLKKNTKLKSKDLLDNDLYGFYETTVENYTLAIELAKENWKTGENLSIPTKGIQKPLISLFDTKVEKILPKAKKWKESLSIILQKVSFLLPEDKDASKCCCGHFIIDVGDDQFELTQSGLRDIKVIVLVEKQQINN
jgi:hypothetical protein